MSRATPSYHHGALRKALLEEAAKLIEDDGVDALTLRELARRLNVSHAAPAHHFSDKSVLLCELAADGFEELSDSLEASGARGRTAVLRLRDVGRAYVRFALDRPGHYRVMFGRELGKRSTPRLLEASGRAYALLERAVSAALPPARAQSAERVREAAFLAWSGTHGAAMLLIDGPPLRGVPEKLRASTIQSLVDHLTTTLASAIGATDGT